MLQTNLMDVGWGEEFMLDDSFCTFGMEMSNVATSILFVLRVTHTCRCCMLDAALALLRALGIVCIRLIPQ